MPRPPPRPTTSGRCSESPATSSCCAIPTRPATSTESNDMNFKDCSIQRNLDADGRAQAARIGDEFRKHGIAELRLISSQYCRAIDTAKLTKLGPVSRNAVLNQVLLADLATMSEAGSKGRELDQEESRPTSSPCWSRTSATSRRSPAPSSNSGRDGGGAFRQVRRGRRRRQDHRALTGRGSCLQPGWRRIGADAAGPWHFGSMTDDLPLAAEFPPASREDWLKLVRAALKDRPFERLIAKTYDGIPIEPLYGAGGRRPPDRGAPRPLGGAGARRSSRSGRGQRRGAARTGRTARPG